MLVLLAQSLSIGMVWFAMLKHFVESSLIINYIVFITFFFKKKLNIIKLNATNKRLLPTEQVPLAQVSLQLVQNF